MWIVQLQQFLVFPHGEVRASVICGCDTEEAAHAAGRLAVKCYDDDWWSAPDAGCVRLSMQPHFPMFFYTVKYQEREWI